MLEQGKEHVSALTEIFANISDWSAEKVKKALDEYGVSKNIKAGQYLPALRASICGTMESPGLIEVIVALGKDEVLNRMKNL